MMVQPLFSNDSERDLAALQGSWKQIDFEENGLSNPPDSHGAHDALTTFRDSHFEVRSATGVLLLEGEFTLDASVEPKAITWMDAMGADKGKLLPAIYRLEGDRFIFIAADEGMLRPTTFRTTSGLTMRTFVRR